MIVLSLLALSGWAEANDFFYADEAHTVVDVGSDDVGLILNGGLRAWRTGEILAKVTSPDVVGRIEATSGIAYAEEFRSDRGIYRIFVDSGANEIALSRTLADLPGVAFAHPNLELDLVPHELDDPLMDVTWHLNNTGQSGGLPGVDVGAFDAWETTYGEGQIIAIVDSGVDMGHPDLDLLPGRDVLDNDDDPSPDPEYSGNAHGTAMAGIAGAIGDNGIGLAGIAPKAKILPIKLLGTNSGDFGNVYRAWTYAVDQGASVVSNSWGYGTNGCTPFPTVGVIADAMTYAEENGRDGRGASIAMSLGNGGCNADNNQMHNDERMISVGAANDIDQRADYSNYGKTLEVMGFGAGNGRPGMWTTDLVGNVGYNNNENGDYWDGGSGTSSACASVAGVIALMYASNERLTAAEVREVLCDTAVKASYEEAAWDAEGHSDFYGCGRVDAGAAVATVANLTPSVEALPTSDGTPSRVQLQWAGSDGDNEALTYWVRVWVDGNEENVLFEGEFAGEEAILVGELPVGLVPYAWSVTVYDSWGAGNTALGEPFMVTQPEEIQGSCSVAPAPMGGLGAVLIGLLALARRRRSS